MIGVKWYQPSFFKDGQEVELGSEENNLSFDSLSICTFNAGILYGKVFNYKYFEPTPYTKERFDGLVGEIQKLQVDVIGIQEIYRVEDKNKVIEALSTKYPYAVYFKRRQLLKVGLHNGLLFLSKYPISEAKFERYDRNPITEKVIADKGILSITLNNGQQPIIITNTHTTVGGIIYDTESDKANSIRDKQVLQSIALTEELSNQKALEVVLGDFNAGPGISEVNYQTMLDKGFVDSYLEFCEQCAGITWTPHNKLNQDGHFESSPPQRIDNIFLRNNGALRYQISDGGVVLNQEVIETKDQGLITVSDHFGYYCQIDFLP